MGQPPRRRTGHALEAVSREAPAKNRRVLFTAVMLFIPVLFFVVLEAGLRLAGFGSTYPLFHPVPGAEEYLIQNRDVARRYFARQPRVPTSIGDAFLADKSPDTYRIFVQGGSSAAGYPYYYGGSFSRMLQQRLQQTFPERPIEVVNTAMAAVNSYTLLDLAGEIRAQEPDAVLIYAGHNEFYGALGVGSAESLGKSRFLIRAYLRLQRWRTVQLVRRMLAGAAGALASTPDGTPGSTLMERMVGEQQIPLGSPVYRAGIAQFDANLRDLLAVYEGIPVYIGTVASNERDHAPFLSLPESGRDTGDWERALARASRLDAPGGLALLDSLAATDSLAADVHFLRGRMLDGLGRFPEALDAYVAAKDRDRLRFRASEDINRVIRERAEASGALVVEVRQALAAASPGSVIDGTLMLEHLHPNADGYFLMADAFYSALVRSGDLGNGSWVPAVAARNERLLTPIDSLFGAYRVLQLMGSWPFQPPGTVWADTLVARSPVEDVTIRLFRGETSWFEATNALLGLQQDAGDYRGALQTALAQIQQYPFLPGPYAAAGEVLLRQQRVDEALVYFGAALEREESAAVREVMGDVHAVRGHHQLALEQYLEAARLNTANADYALKVGRSQAALGDSLAAIGTLEQYLARNPGQDRVERVLTALRSATGR